jgi:hypothetical protein
MKAKNINGTSDSPKCPCIVWLKHWENYSGKKASYCSEKTCSKTATMGAHVLKEGQDQSWYIIPLCADHNNKRGQEIEASDSTIFVPATARNKCKP